MSKVKSSLQFPSPAAGPSRNPPRDLPLLPPATQSDKPHSRVFKTGPFSILFCPIKILHSQVEIGERDTYTYRSSYIFIYIHTSVQIFIYSP